MTPDQARKLRMSTEAVTAFTSGNEAAELPFEVEDMGAAIDGMFLLALSLASIIASSRGQDLDAALDALPRMEVEIMPEAGINWDVGLRLVKALPNRQPDPSTISVEMDVPTALQTGFSMSMSALFELDGKQGRDQFEWLKFVWDYASNVERLGFDPHAATGWPQG